MGDTERVETESPVANHTLEKYHGHGHLKKGDKLWMHSMGPIVDNKRVKSLSSLADHSPVTSYVALHRSSETNYISRDHSTRDAPETILYDYRKYIPVYHINDERESHVTKNLILRHKTRLNGAQNILKRSKGLNSKEMQLAISDRTSNPPDYKFYGDDPFDSSNETTTQATVHKPEPRQHHKHMRLQSVSSDGSFTSLDFSISSYKKGPKTDDLALIPVTTPPSKQLTEATSTSRTVASSMSSTAKALKSYFERAGEKIKAEFARLCTRRCQGTEPLLKAGNCSDSFERGTDD